MDKTRHQYEISEDKEFKLLLRKDVATGGLSVAASSSGAWVSNISIGISAEGAPCCTAVISPGPDMLETAAEVLLPSDERNCIEDEAAESAVIEQATDEKLATAPAAADEHENREAETPDQGSKPEKKLEGRPFEEIAKGAAKKASDAKPSGSKQTSKPLSGSRQTARTLTGSSQSATRR